MAAELAGAATAEEGVRALSCRLVALLSLLALVVAGCGGAASGDSSGSPAEPTATRAAAALVAPTPAVEPVRFPEDEAPHDDLTEWWYYTGHLFTEDGTRYGFEYVIFQAQRGAFPPYYAAHFAVTDSVGQRFAYDQRAGPNARRGAESGFDLDLGGWTMAGALGRDHLTADMDGYAIDLDLTATKPPALHDGDGYVSFGPAGGSYYYSRTRIDVRGTLAIDGVPLPVTGEAWMDHQWGNFIQVGGGGWDWFSAQLGSGLDLTISLVRSRDGSLVTAYGTIVDPDGVATHLAADDIDVRVLDTWTSPTSGATYPAAWEINAPSHGLSVRLTPTVADQELDTQETTGVIYWEGEVLISGTVGSATVAGLGYVELTGYAASESRLAPVGAP